MARLNPSSNSSPGPTGPFSAFEDKLLSRLEKLDRPQVQSLFSRLLAQKQFLQTIFDHLQEGVLVTDRSLHVLYVSRRARQMLGWRRGRDYVGANIATLVAAEHPLHDCLGALRGSARASEPIECAYGPKLARTMSITALPLRGQMNNDRDAQDDMADEELLIVLLNDVTERHKRQAEQARARRLISLATMTSGIAHEIKNPLNSINIHAQLLLSAVDDAERRGRTIDPAKARRAGEVILEETARLTRIVEEFIQAARPRTPQLEAQALRPMLESVERIFRPQCEQTGVEFDVVIEHGLPHVLFDAHLLVQALRNLLRNALDAVGERARHAEEPGESFAPRLTLEAHLAGEHIDLVVGDNGTGIAADALEHIFEPYFTTRFHGSGLGLMVVYRIVSDHHGMINVDTRPGEGTRFTIALPLAERPVRLLEEAQAEKTTKGDA